MLVVNYIILSHNYVLSPIGLGMQTEVRDPEENIILSRIYSAEGKIANLPTEYKIWLLVPLSSQNRSNIIYFAFARRTLDLFVHQ